MIDTYNQLHPDALVDLLRQKDDELARERAERQAQAQRDGWMAELDKQIRDLFGASVDAFSQQVLHALVKRFPSLVGGIYCLTDIDSRKSMLELQGTYGLTKSQASHPVLQMGEGLAGECARTGQPIQHPFEADAPFEYTDRALVKMRPKAVYLEPLNFNGLVVGVLELYTVDTLPEAERTLLHDACVGIAAALAAMLKQEQVQKLLKNSQLLIQQQKTAEEELRQNMEEMQSQEEELRQNMEELQATQEEMTRMQLDIQAQIDAVDRSMGVIEFDPQGYILKANTKFIELVGYSHEELIGQHHSLLMPPEARESDAYAAFWQELKAGNFQIGEFLRRDKAGNPLWIYGTYNPVIDRDGRVLRIVKFAADITERKEQEKQLVEMERLEEAMEEVQAREAEITRLLTVTQFNEKQLQEVEQSYRATIEQLSLRVKQLETELASTLPNPA